MRIRTTSDLDAVDMRFGDAVIKKGWITAGQHQSGLSEWS